MSSEPESAGPPYQMKTDSTTASTRIGFRSQGSVSPDRGPTSLSPTWLNFPFLPPIRRHSSRPRSKHGFARSADIGAEQGVDTALENGGILSLRSPGGEGQENGRTGETTHGRGSVRVWGLDDGEGRKVLQER